ncbi:MAG: hypothetical protein HUU60_09190 [Armatimonadetes bacterium]|nr:hypothetical protein [Armatimonadota bacterium]
MPQVDDRRSYLSSLLKQFKEGQLSMDEALNAIRKRKPNQAKMDGAKQFAKMIADGKFDEAFAKYRFGLKNVRGPRRKKKSA